MFYGDAVNLLAPGSDDYVARLTMLSEGQAIFKYKNGVIAEIDIRSGSVSPHDPTRHETQGNDWVMCKITPVPGEEGAVELRVQQVGSTFDDLTAQYPMCKAFRRMCWERTSWLNSAVANGKEFWTRYFPHPTGWVAYELTEEDRTANDWLAYSQFHGSVTVGEKMVATNPADDSEYDAELNAIKNHLAAVLNTLHQRREVATSGEQKRLISIAMTELQGTDLWITKALGWQD